MSDKDFVFRLGPLPDRSEAGYFYFVYPGQPDNYLFPALDDRAAWLAIAASYDLADLACEPSLDTLEKPPGVTSEPHDRYTAHALAQMTYAYLDREPLSAVRTEGLISDLVIASQAFLQSDFAAGRTGEGKLVASFRGDPDIRAHATVATDNDRRRELRMRFDDLTDEVSEEPLAFGVTFEDGPRFAVDAMRRGFGLDSLPLPYVGSAAKRGKPNDTILLLLIAALTALANYTQGGARGQYSIGNTHLECQIE